MPIEQDERSIRISKLEQLTSAGIAIYPETYDKKDSIKDCLEKKEEEKIQTTGRIMLIRSMGKIIFAHIKDQSGKMQIALQQDIIGKEKFTVFQKLIDMGDFLGVKGEIFITKTGEKTILVKEYTFLGKCLRPLPEKYHGIQDKEIKYRQRYLDLLMDQNTMDRFLFRSQFIKTLRDFYEKENFIEVETNVLGNSASGALAKPFTTHHNALDLDVFLRIALETPQKELIVGGFERTFEIGKVFRNEGMDPSHLQEFTMVEHYAAYWNYENNMRFTEKMFEYLLTKLLGTLKISIPDRDGNMVEVDFTPPYQVITFKDLLIKDCGIDIEVIQTTEELRKIIKEKKIDVEDINSLEYGNLIDALYKKVSRPAMNGPIFLIGHPIELSPLARKNDNNPRIVDRFQLVVNGWELVNAYSELVDPLDQKQRFEEQSKAKAKGDKDAHGKDDEYVKSMEYGMPPISGLGMGIDRLIALLTKQSSLRDVILFPLMKPEYSENKTVASSQKTMPVYSHAVIINKEVQNKFKGLKIGYAVIENVTIKKVDTALESLKKEMIPSPQKAAKMLEELSVLEDYRTIFKETGIDPTKRKPSSIALLDRITEGKDLYTINTVVDALNLIVIKYGITFGVYDLDHVKLPLELRFAQEGEEMLPLLEEQAQKLKEGELVYADKEKITCRSLNYRDSDYTKITEKTKNIFITIDGTQGVSQKEVITALQEACQLITTYNGGNIISMEVNGEIIRNEKSSNDKKINAGISYEQALKIFDEHTKDPITRNHSRESEVVMRALAKRLGENEEVWGIAGLLHDIDWEYTQNDVKNHCVKAIDILKKGGVSNDLIEVIISHAYGTECGDYQDKVRTTSFQHALAAGETVTGLIYAYGLMRPDKKLANAEVKSIKKKFKDKSFAAKVDRDVIQECEQCGLSLDEFLQIALDAMKEIAPEIGL